MASTLPRLGSWFIALVIGAVYGAACTIAHAYTIGPIPLGFALAVMGMAALLAAVRLLTIDRWAALSAGVGAVAATFVFSGSGPGGSVIVQSTVLGVVWMVALPVIVAVVIAWPPSRTTARREAPDASN